LFERVDLIQVVSIVIASGEELLTKGTLEGPFSGVYPFVPLHVGREPEHFQTEGALVLLYV